MANSRDFVYEVVGFKENYDGDSFHLVIDLGFRMQMSASCRLRGADTPEMRGGDKVSKAAAKLAKKFVFDFIADAMGDGLRVCFHSYELDKYGRPLGDVVVEGVSLAETLIEAGMAVAYHGQNKADVQAAHEENYRRLIKEGKI